MDRECGHGMCNKTTCVCHPRYTNSTCNYHRKSQLSSFFFGFFLGVFGGARYYLSLIVSGLFQTFLLCFCCVSVVGAFLGWDSLYEYTCCEDCEDECKILWYVCLAVSVIGILVWFVSLTFYQSSKSFVNHLVVCCSHSPFTLFQVAC